MAHVAICSLVRNGMEYLPIYRAQLENTRLAKGDTWHLYALEGDSRDNSSVFLERWAEKDPRVTVGHKDVGEPAEGEEEEVQWAEVANACFDLIPAGSPHTHVLWLEPDLCFPPGELLAMLLSRNVDIVAPIVFLGGIFYDTWGFRDLSGRRWKNAPPFHPDYRPHATIEMGSVGSCVLFRRAVIDAGIRMRGTNEDGLLVGMCNDARKAGFRVWADTRVAILHPVNRWAAQMWRPDKVQIFPPDGQPVVMSISEADKMGLRHNLPRLDRNTFLTVQNAFLENVCGHFKVDGVDIEVKARRHPKRTYDLVLRGTLPSPDRTAPTSEVEEPPEPSRDPDTGQPDRFPITITFED